METIGELLVKDISWEADFLIAGIKKGETLTSMVCANGVQVLCQFGQKLRKAGHLDTNIDDWIPILHRVARGIEKVCMGGYDDSSIAQTALDEIGKLIDLF